MIRDKVSGLLCHGGTHQVCHYMIVCANIIGRWRNGKCRRVFEYMSYGMCTYVER